MASNESALRAKAQKALGKGDIAGALAAYQQLLKIHPEDARLWVNVGDLCAKIGQNQTALDIYARAVERYSQEFRLEEAIRICRKMLALKPGDAKLKKRLANLESRVQISRAAKRGNDTIHRWQLEQQQQQEAEIPADTGSFEVEFGSRLPDAPPAEQSSTGSDNLLLEILAEDPSADTRTEETQPVTLDKWLAENPQGVTAEDLFATTQELRRVIVEKSKG
ncbi:MAG: hypothetical protein D6761_06395 [Candidatus Dadabacteria bacterium]|nr:MAG: hypothetical protein D6761_06395 [Candidatus Dadabacteria bacterium]